MKRREITALLLALVLTAVLVPALGEAGAEEPVENPFLALELTDLYGEPFDAAVFSEQPFLINIWATWCGPCRSEMPALEALSQKYAGRFRVLGLLAQGTELNSQGEVLPAKDEIEGAKALYESMGLSYPTLLPDFFFHAAMYQLQLQAFPTTWFFNGEGQLLGQVVGARSEAQWEEMILSVLDALEKADGTGPS